MTTPDEQKNNPDSFAPGDTGLAGRLGAVHRAVRQAAQNAGRMPHEITLIAVSKTKPLSMIEACLEAGQLDLGESRIQEALPKLEAHPEARWHLIGHLQTNKARQAAGRFELIHSVDSVRLLKALEDACAKNETRQNILLQINVSGEAAKFGAAPEALPELRDALEHCPHLHGLGLMTIPPYDDDPETSRPHFAALRELLATQQASERFTPRHLSMGMSGDYQVAIEEGATLVRVGTAIFGSR